MNFIKGEIACLQNLLLGSENHNQMSNLYVSESCIASVAKLNTDYLKYVLSQNTNKLEKLWTQLAWRMVILYKDQLKLFSTLSQDKLRLFCRMCTIKLYKPGQKVNLINGGILFRGSLSKLKKEEPEAENLMGPSEDDDAGVGGVTSNRQLLEMLGSAIKQQMT